MSVVSIIQARMGSTRFPGKVLRPLAGKPMLTWVLERVQTATSIDQAIVATTSLEQDVPIVEFCEEHGWTVSRGSEHDLLDRYYQAAKQAEAEVVVRITSDCPLMDPKLMDAVVDTFQRYHSGDYVSNTKIPPSTFPPGMDIEVIRFGALERAWYEDKNPAWREHVTPYIYRNPDKFNIKAHAGQVDYSHLRLTVDTLEDHDLINKLLLHLSENFEFQDVIHLLQNHPEWQTINQHVQQKNVD